MTDLSSQMVMRLRVPCTLTELALILHAPIRTVRALAYQLRARGSIERMDRRTKNQPGRGRKEFFWIALGITQQK